MTRLPAVAPAVAPAARPLPAGALHTLCALRPWTRAAQLLTQWAVIALAIALAEAAQAWAVTLPALIVIATRQHALLVLMHEAAHRLIARRPWLNDAIGNLLLAFPLTLSVARYRAHHFRHHRHLNTREDPDFADSVLPPGRRHFFGLLLRDLTGWSALATLRSAQGFGLLGLFAAQPAAVRQERALAVVFLAVAVAGIAGLGLWRALLLYWLLPMLVFLPAILRVRGIAEHGGRLDAPAAMAARSLRVGWLERCLWAPCHINRHWEHHRHPAVPCYALPRLSALLAEADPACAAARPTLGYFIGPRSLLHELFPVDAAAREHAAGGRQ